MSGIIVSEKHGVNPSVSQCFFCGKDVGLVLFGKMKGDKEAPKKCGVIDDTPCHECEKYMKLGVIFISIKDDETDMDNPYRTGKFSVVKDEAVKRMISNENLLTDVLKKRVCFIEDKVWTHLGLPEKDIDNTKT